VEASFSCESRSLVGRERELGVLRDHLAEALGGRGSLVLISGEAGIGKTALAETICREAAEQGALVLVGRCYDLTETPPYGPWVELFGRYRREGGMPPVPDAFAERGVVGAVASQPALFQRVRDFFAALTASCPVLVLLDDLHWADPASLDLLRFIARSVGALPLLLVVTYRSDELTRRHPFYQLLPLLVRESHAARLDLGPLSDGALREIVAARYRLDATDESRLVTYLRDRTDGNALFAVEVLRSLEEQGAVCPEGDAWRVRDLGGVIVPSLVQQVIDSRVARLGETARRLLAVAAVIGHEVPLAIWATVAEADEDTLLDLAERAAAVGIIEGVGEGDAVRFRHALIREALYEGVPPLRRRHVHRRVAEALSMLRHADSDAVAYHFRQAGDTRAILWLYRSATRAAWAFALTTALDRVESALTLLTTMTLSEGPFSSNDENGALAAHVLFTRGVIRCQEGMPRRGLADMEAAVAALDGLRIADDGPFRALLGQWGIPFDRRIELVQWLAPTGHYARGRALAERLLPDTRAEGNGAENVSGDAAYRIAFLHYALGLIHGSCGRPEEARREFRLRRADSGAAVPLSRVGLLALHELVFVAIPYETDNPDALDHLVREAEEALRRARDRPPDIPPRFVHIPLLVVRGQWQEARALAEAMVALDIAGTYRHIPARALATLGATQGDWAYTEAWTRVELPDGPRTEPGDGFYPTALLLQRLAAMRAMSDGDYDAARVWLAAHDRWLAWNGTVLGRSEGEVLWARYHRDTGDNERASRYAAQAFRHASEPRQPLALIAAQRLLGELATERGVYEEARQHLGASLALADTCAAPYERSLTLLAFADLYVAERNADAARASANEARAICAPLGAKPMLHRADRIGARVDAMANRAPRYPAGLSAREVEVLRLLAAGKTNREIADALFLSEHTIHVHVRNIFAKTRTDNRTEAATFALRHGIA
jgi:DNA-binding CsgD family transcriptional regulator